MNKKPIVAGNWKMNKTLSQGKEFIHDVKNLVPSLHNTEVVFFPTYPGLVNIKLSSPFHLGAQNCHWEESGAFTGEISIEMLRECSVEYIIVGHSERRQLFNENDHMINKKIKAILSSNLKPILCVGETIEDRNSDLTEDFLKNQLLKGLEGVKSINDCIIAYEPIWAIGTGETANKDQIYKAHNFINSVLKKVYPESDNCHILYGGSVNTENAKDLIQIIGVDGFLIGGASLDKDSFVSIINHVEKN
tara:strand:+ start:229 stop:972 length:744 start_codon:yes stop_codon:yes gene_type:complete